MALQSFQVVGFQTENSSSEGPMTLTILRPLVVLPLKCTRTRMSTAKKLEVDTRQLTLKYRKV